MACKLSWHGNAMCSRRCKHIFAASPAEGDNQPTLQRLVPARRSAKDRADNQHVGDSIGGLACGVLD